MDPPFERHHFLAIQDFLRGKERVVFLGPGGSGGLGRGTGRRGGCRRTGRCNGGRLCALVGQEHHAGRAEDDLVAVLERDRAVDPPAADDGSETAALVGDDESAVLEAHVGVLAGDFVVRQHHRVTRGAADGDWLFRIQRQLPAQVGRRARFDLQKRHGFQVSGFRCQRFEIGENCRPMTQTLAWCLADT